MPQLGASPTPLTSALVVAFILVGVYLAVSAWTRPAPLAPKDPLLARPQAAPAVPPPPPSTPLPVRSSGAAPAPVPRAPSKPVPQVPPKPEPRAPAGPRGSDVRRSRKPAGPAGLDGVGHSAQRPTPVRSAMHGEREKTPDAYETHDPSHPRPPMPSRPVDPGQEWQRRARHRMGKPKPPRPEWLEQHLARYRFDELRNDGLVHLPREVWKVMRHAELCALANPADSASSYRAPAAEDDWHPAHGSLPRAAYQAALQIGALLKDKHVAGVRAHLASVPGRGQDDGAARWQGLVERMSHPGLQLSSGQPAGPDLAVAWFADTYRQTDPVRRVGIVPDLAAFEGRMRAVGAVLGWLEYVGELFAHQRVRGRGLELDGLALRLNCAKTGPRAYCLKVTLFLWGEAPPAERSGRSGPGVEVEVDATWAARLARSVGALRAPWAELMWAFGEFDDVDCSRRRLVFRPGWDMRKVQVPTAGLVDDAGDTSARVLVFRSFVMPSYDVERDGRMHALGQAVRAIAELIEPPEVVFSSKRQFHWDAQLQRSGRRDAGMSLDQFGAAFQACDDLRDYHFNLDDSHCAHYMKRLDLGGYVPLVERSWGYDLAHLKNFDGLHELYLAFFRPEDSPAGIGTVDLFRSPYQAVPGFLRLGWTEREKSRLFLETFWAGTAQHDAVTRALEIAFADWMVGEYAKKQADAGETVEDWKDKTWANDVRRKAAALSEKLLDVPMGGNGAKVAPFELNGDNVYRAFVEKMASTSESSVS